MESRPFPLFLAAGLVLCLCRPLPPAAAAEEAPSDIVARLNAVLMEVMHQADELGFSGRYDRLAPVLSEAFNFPLMARISVGRNWRKLEDSDRDRLVDAFGRLSIATFAARFDGYSGERFEVLGEKPAPRKAIMVRNRLIKNDGEAVVAAGKAELVGLLHDLHEHRVQAPDDVARRLPGRGRRGQRPAQAKDETGGGK